jgi:hypothetical protein
MRKSNHIDGGRISPPASPRQRWILELWDRGVYRGCEIYATEFEAKGALRRYDEQLSKSRKGKNARTTDQ